eukprot:1097206_1
MADVLDYNVVPHGVCRYSDDNAYEILQNSLRQLLYNLSNLKSLCVVHKDDEWKQEFITSKAWDHLIKLYLKYYLISETDPRMFDCCEVLYLGITMLFKIMYHLCSALSPSAVSLQKFIRNAYDAPVIQMDNILSTQQNYLISLMVMDAKLGNADNIGLLNVIPYQVTRTYSEVLIRGFITICQLSQNIPH